MNSNGLVRGVLIVVAASCMFAATAGAADENDLAGSFRFEGKREAVAGAPEAAPPPPAQKLAKEIPLYPGAAPGSEKWDWSERSVPTPLGLPVVTDVVRPVLLRYPAEKAKAIGTAMIVAPGGGFRALMMSYTYRKGKGPAELHVFQKGAHGFVNKGGGADHFMDRLEEWLGANKLLTKPTN